MASRLISSAIAAGAPAYNSGETSLCASIYAETASRLLNEYKSELTPEVASALAAALEESNSSPLGGKQGKGSAADRLAWSFRQAFDQQMSERSFIKAVESYEDSSVEAMISRAIARGAPAYNRGSSKECADIYVDVSQQILRRTDISDDDRRRLDAAVSQAQSSGSSADNSAWTLRKALDACARGNGKVTTTAFRAAPPQNSNKGGKGAMVRNFSLGAGLELQAACVNDTVMGGRSSSSIRMTNEGALFEGVVTKRGGGGFVSVRFQANDRNALASALLSGTGVACSVKCLQGCTSWKLQLNEGRNGTQWQAGFNALQGSEQVVRIPYTTFFPTWRGRLQGGPGISSSDLEGIQAVGFMMSFLEDDGSLSDKFQEGQFALLIKWISVY